MKSVLAAAMLLILSSAGFAFATASVALLAGGDGKSFTLQAAGFENLSAVDMAIIYEPSILTNPTVTPGSFAAGSMLVPNTKQAGMIRIAMVTSKALNNGGSIATIAFQRRGSGSAHVRFSAVSSIGQDLLPKPIIPVNPTEVATGEGDTSGGSQDQEKADGQQTQAQAQQTPQTTSSSPTVIGGTVTLPSDATAPIGERKSQQATPEYRDEEQQRQPQSGTRQTAQVQPEPRQQDQEQETKSILAKVEPPPSIVARFKAFKGQLTSKVLIDLFAADEKATAKQEPPILLADGKANLKITIQNPQGKQAPNFALKKAKLVSLKTTSNHDWVIVARPEKGTWDASITMIIDDAAVEFSLTVAPVVDIDLDRSGKIDEKDLGIFLKERGTVKVPKYDLNKDGRRDSIDDYIFTANYLVKTQKTKAPGVKVPEKTQEGKSKGDRLQKDGKSGSK